MSHMHVYMVMVFYMRLTFSLRSHYTPRTYINTEIFEREKKCEPLYAIFCLGVCLCMCSGCLLCFSVLAV